MAIQFSKEDEEKLKNSEAEIYQKRTEETNRRDIQNLSGKAKWQQFRDYYLKIVIILVLIAALLIVGVVQSMTSPATALYIVILNDAFDEDKLEAFEEAVGEYLELNENKETVVVNTAVTDQQLQTLFYAGTADILITDDETFQEWGEAQYFYDSESNKEVSFYKEYGEDYLFRTQYVTGEDVLENEETRSTETQASDQTEYNCGIYLTDSDKYRQLGGGIEKPVLGISNMTKHLDEVTSFVQYMMDNSQQMDLE